MRRADARRRMMSWRPNDVSNGVLLDPCRLARQVKEFAC